MTTPDQPVEPEEPAGTGNSADSAHSTASRGSTPGNLLGWARMTGAPVVVLTLLTALLGVMYLGYVADPEQNLHDFPIALVNQDSGDVLDTGNGKQQVDFGRQVADGIIAAVPADKVELHVVGISEAERLLQTGQVYGAVVIPSDFSKSLGILGIGSVVPGDIQRPIVTVETNPRAGAYSTQVVLRIADEMLARVNDQVGRQLTDQVESRLRSSQPGAPATELSGASRVALREPINVLVQQYHPLPDGTGQGLTAFFYALLLLLAGVVGAMIIHTMVDAQLGFVPTEYGPWYVHYPPTPISRFRTVLLKWAVMTVAAAVVAGVFLLTSHLLDLPLSHGLGLFLYSWLAIAAVGITGISMLAAIGSAGLLANLILFVVLGLPSSGGTVPIEATPPYFAWLATFEPMHQVFLAIRSILYFDASGPAGLTRGVWMTLLGLGIGLVFGAVVTRFYDHRGLHRKNVLDREPATAG